MDAINQIITLTDATGASGSSNNLFYIFLIIIPIALVIFFIVKKKKGNDKDKSANGNRLKNKQESDEVWLTVKRFLRDKNEKGKEVIDSYVVKRPDPFNKSAMNKEQKKEYKQKQKALKELKKTDPDQYKLEKARIAIQKRKKPPELYVVLFTTKDTKTGAIDEPRAIECEVVYKKINKNNRERTIVINKVLDYDTEMKWIKSIKDKDDKQYEKQLKREQKREERIKAKKARKAELEKAKKAQELAKNSNSNK